MTGPLLHFYVSNKFGTISVIFGTDSHQRVSNVCVCNLLHLTKWDAGIRHFHGNHL